MSNYTERSATFSLVSVWPRGALHLDNIQIKFNSRTENSDVLEARSERAHVSSRVLRRRSI